MKNILLTTQDGVKIAANLYFVEKPTEWLILSHMMPATKESWQDFAKIAQEKGYESIAIDLRGHGESRLRAQTNADLTQTNAEELNFLDFSNTEHQKSILDIQAAVDYLIKERKATPEKIIFIGASIGANLSLQYIIEHPEYKTAILPSPGLNYRGIKTEPMAKKLQTGQNVFFISAIDDGNNAKENQELFDLTPNNVNKKIQIYKTGGHGTNILKNQPELTNLIFNFIK